MMQPVDMAFDRDSRKINTDRGSDSKYKQRVIILNDK